MSVIRNHDVTSENGKEKISANNFYVDLEDVKSLDDKEIIARSNAQAWNPETDDYISIAKIEYDLKEELGQYPVKFSTSNGTSIERTIFVVNQPFVKNEKANGSLGCLIHCGRDVGDGVLRRRGSLCGIGFYRGLRDCAGQGSPRAYSHAEESGVEKWMGFCGCWCCQKDGFVDSEGRVQAPRVGGGNLHRIVRFRRGVLRGKDIAAAWGKTHPMLRCGR
jgi:hypothetical protein